ncbi:hypothetical protein X961_4874 [Burkholderia pseudomallei MSHR5613]|nr:hypothetical protein X961_4874 [Burkholderia pseudomallei MSHR5613]
MRIGKLQRSGGKRHIMRATQRFQLRDTFNHFNGRIAVVELPVTVYTSRENPGIENPTEQDANATRFAGGQQIINRRLLQQRVSAGKQRTIDIEFRHRVENHGAFIDAEANGLHCAARTQFVERAKTTSIGQLRPVVSIALAMRHAANIMNQHDVDIDHTETLLAIFERTQNPITGVVVHCLERQWIPPSFATVVGHRPRYVATPHFRRQNIVTARIAAQRIAQSVFGLRMAVMRRRIEVAHTGCPRGIDRRRRFLV